MHCPVCGTFATSSIPVKREVDGRQKTFYINHCTSCDVRFDQRVECIDEGRDKEAQAVVNVDFYKPSFSEQEYDELLAINKAMLVGLTRFCRLRDVYVELGVGLGILTRAAASTFGRVYGLDLEVETAKSVAPIPANVEFWNFPNPHNVLRPLVMRMPSSAVTFGQIPLFKPEHVYDAHFVYYTERSLLALFGSYGFSPVLLEKDETNDFLAYCFRKL
jgi:hypothetical protein